MSNQQKKPPILNHQNKVIFNKIILIYAVFYVALKAYVIIFNNQWFVENLILAFPLIVIGLLAFYFQKQKTQNWYFIFISFGTALLIRLNEQQWILKLHQFLN